MEETVQKCLIECEQKGAHSIAFPALGAGNLGYPSKVVAEVMITTVQNYYRINTTSCITEVKFVIFKDNTYEEFKRLLSELSDPEMVLSGVNGMPVLSQHHSPFSLNRSFTPGTLSSKQSPNRGFSSTSVSAVPFKLFKGELLEQQVMINIKLMLFSIFF